MVKPWHILLRKKKALALVVTSPLRNRRGYLDSDLIRLITPKDKIPAIKSTNEPGSETATGSDSFIEKSTHRQSPFPIADEGEIPQDIVPVPSGREEEPPSIFSNVKRLFMYTSTSSDRKSTRLNSSHVKISYA